MTSCGPQRGREQTGVGRDHEIVGKAALQAEARHAKRAVLIVGAGVLHVVRGFRDAPWHPHRLRVLDVAADDRLVRLVKQRAGIGAHDEKRHQVLEHRRAPRHERAMRSHRRHQPAQLEPVLLRHVAHGDGDEARQSRLGCQRVVIGRIAPALGDVVANREELPLAIEEKVELGVVDELFDGVVKTSRRALPGELHLVCRPLEFGKITAPLPDHRRRAVQPPVGAGDLRVSERQPVLRIVKARSQHGEF